MIKLTVTERIVDLETDNDIREVEHEYEFYDMEDAIEFVSKEVDEWYSSGSRITYDITMGYKVIDRINHYNRGGEKMTVVKYKYEEVDE